MQCRMGVGLVDPKAEQYGTAAPGDCLPCALEGCAACNYNYKTCDECAPGYGATTMLPCTEYDGCPSQPEACARCPSGCGACSIDATQCTAPVTDCATTAPVEAATDAKKEDYDTTQGEADGGYCSNPPGSYGNGYVITYTGLVEDGVCINCGDTTAYSEKYDVEGFGARIPPFCDMLDIAKSVAANAFDGCTDPTLTLNSTCHSSRSFPGSWSMDFTFIGECDGQTMGIQVAGGWNATLAEEDVQDESGNTPLDNTPLPTSEWTWAAQPAVASSSSPAPAPVPMPVPMPAPTPTPTPATPSPTPSSEVTPSGTSPAPSASPAPSSGGVRGVGAVVCAAMAAAMLAS